MSHRKPTALKIIEGNPGKRALPLNEPQPEVGCDPPSWLSVVAREHWDVIAQDLTDVGVLTRMDKIALSLYCEAFARYRDASERVQRHGTIMKSPSGYPIQSPYLAIANKAHEQMVKLLIQFGCMPAARTKVEVSKKSSGTTKGALKKYL